MLANADVIATSSDGRIDALERLMLAQAEEIAEMRSLLQFQKHELSVHKQLLNDQKAQLRDQNVKLSALETRVAEKDVELSAMKNQVSKQTHWMKQLARHCNNKCRGADGMRPEKQSSHASDTSRNQDSEPNKVNAATKLSVTGKQHDMEKWERLVKVQVRSLSERADDGGALEVVVNQLGQKVNQLDADVQAQQTQLQALQTQVAQQNVTILDARTSTFVRWGNTQCGSSAKLVYSGVVGGSYFNNPGSAANYLCLTLSPVPGDHKNADA
jgi:hypothetical protein